MEGEARAESLLSLPQHLEDRSKDGTAGWRVP